MSEKIEGDVFEVNFQPGRADGLITLGVIGQPNTLPADVMLLTKTPETQITIDGLAMKPMDGDQINGLLTVLFNHHCKVVAHPRTDHYGSATKAEFTTVTEKAANH